MSCECPSENVVKQEVADDVVAEFNKALNKAANTIEELQERYLIYQ